MLKNFIWNMFKVCRNNESVVFAVQSAESGERKGRRRERKGRREIDNENLKNVLVEFFLLLPNLTSLKFGENTILQYPNEYTTLMVSSANDAQAHTFMTCHRNKWNFLTFSNNRMKYCTSLFPKSTSNL